MPLTIHTTPGSPDPWILDGSRWVNAYTGRARSAVDTDARRVVSVAGLWRYNRRPDGVGELVLPVPGLRGPLHTIAPPGGRMPDGDYPAEVGVMATSGRPWLRIIWGDPDGLDDHGFHVGNVPEESRGCIFPGLAPDVGGVADSAAAMRIVVAVARGCGVNRVVVRTVA